MKIILTGGGTAGHVVPNLALKDGLLAAGFEISYIGGKNGMERGLVEDAGIAYHGISVGKLRRYLSLKNVSDAFRVVKGAAEAQKIIRKTKPNIIFSKGGFASVPVVLAARLQKVPVVIHESDITVGLANKLAIPHAKKVCYVFPETLKYLPKDKSIHTGTPLRAEILNGSAIKGAQMCKFADEKPVVMIMGGSSGSAAINAVLREALSLLLPNFNIIHLCGKNNADSSLESSGYRQFEYVTHGMGDLYAASTLVVSRAGSNSLAELLALTKPHVLIPLPRAVSRGDQILNAESFEKQGFSIVLNEEEMSADSFARTIQETFEKRGIFKAAMTKGHSGENGVAQIIQILKDTAKPQ